jgi:Tol biopolymer transport system component
MYCLSRQPKMMRRPRAALYRFLTFTAFAALGACDGGVNPLAPSDDPAGLGEEALVPDLASVTTGQRILFTSGRNGGYDTYMMTPQGSGVVQVTSFQGDETAPAWSWDNKRIAVVRTRLGSDNIKRPDIYVMNADGTGKRWVRSLSSSFGMGSPSWSPDGSRLVVVVALGGRVYLATMDVATGNMAFVLCGNELIEGSYPSYDPTGKSILYVARDFASINRCVGGDSIRIVSSAPSRIGRVAWSPDGKKIVYNEAVGSNYNSEIFVKDLVNGSVKRLTSSGAYDGYPTWSSDGSRIAFVRKQSGGAFQLYTMNSATGGNLTRITNTNTEEFSPAWSH